MEDITKINKINAIIKTYFEQHPQETIVSAKDVMTDFIRGGIFSKDEKHGLPIRKVLRELDEDGKLDLIPYVYAERKDKNTNWHFVPSKETIPERVLSKKEEALKARSQSDESYILDLCDRVIGKKAVRQKRFDFLLGDFHKDGITRTKLPVAAFYQSLNLVIEHYDINDSSIASESAKKTISGVSREEQRKIYNSRRASVLNRNDIKLITISYTDFHCDENKKIVRNEETDLAIVKQKLKKFVE